MMSDPVEYPPGSDFPGVGAPSILFVVLDDIGADDESALRLLMAQQ